MPTRLQGRYEQAQADPDLLNLNDEIRLTDTFILDALKGLDVGDSGKLWYELKETWDVLEDAQRAKDKAGVAHALNAIGTLIRRGLAAYAARTETMDLVERRRKLVDSESKRRISMQQMITAERATLLVSAMANVVMRHVDDARVRAAISAEVGALFMGDVPGRD